MPTTGYTLRAVLTGSTTPTASAVFSGCVALVTNATTESDLYTSNMYPNDLTVWYAGNQIDCNVEVFSNSLIVVAFAAQIGITASTVDASDYVLAWGKSSPTVMRTLSNVYLVGDDFASLNGAYVRQNCTASATSGVLTVTPTGGDPAGVIIPNPDSAARGLDVFVYARSALAESAWTVDASRLGAGARVASAGSRQAYELLFHESSPGPVAFLSDLIAWGATYSGFGTMPATTWVGMRLKIPAGGTTAYGKVWLLSAQEPSGWLFSGSLSIGFTETADAKITCPSDATNAISPTYRHFRLARSVVNDPVVTTS